MTTKQKIYAYLISRGMTAAGAAGLIGNLYAESALKPRNLQNTYEKKLGYTDAEYTAAVDSGEYAGFATDCAGYGLAQWTYHTRKTALLAYARNCGASIGDLDMQLAFLCRELAADYPKVLEILCTTQDVREASDAVMLDFERPADVSESARAKRAEYAQQFFDELAEDEILSDTTHTVVSGDTLTKIAGAHGTTVQAILDANTATYPTMTADYIRVGWVLRIAQERYTVQAVGTFGSLADAEAAAENARAVGFADVCVKTA